MKVDVSLVQVEGMTLIILSPTITSSQALTLAHLGLISSSVSDSQASIISRVRSRASRRVEVIGGNRRGSSNCFLSRLSV